MYTIIFYKGELTLGSTPWSNGFETAKTHAQEHMLARGADRVEVRNEFNELRFHYPRTLSA